MSKKILELADKLKSKIYLDYNATTPLRAEVKAELLDALGEPNNPSSSNNK